MKKYKLIKKLPFESSPKVGYISREKPGEGGAHYWNHNWFYPEDYPEFWKEVVEKDYEILTYSWENSMETLVYNVYFDTDIVEMIEDGYDIHSVKRLSDGEVFTIGDYVKSNLVSTGWKGCVISKLLIEGEQIKVEVAQEDSSSLYPLKTLKVVNNKPLFKTEDGVELFEGDNFYYPTSDFKISSGTTPIKSRHHEKSYSNLIKYCNNIGLKFSTKEAAEEYVLVNKPCLSVNDVEDNIVGTLQKSFKERLIKLAKSRL